MKRFNVLLPKNLYLYLEKESENRGLTKAQFIREIIEHRIKSAFTQSNKPHVQPWNLAEELSFNFHLSDEQDLWLEQSSELYECSKGEIIRYIIWQELSDENSRQTLVFKPIIKNTQINPIIENISTLLRLKNYTKLNKFLSELSERKLSTLGEPEFFIKIITELEEKYQGFNPDLLIFKTRMLWFRGHTFEAISELKKIIGSKKIPYEVEIKADILYGEILADMGYSHQAKEWLENTIPKLMHASSWYKVKAYNKLGLSMFYIDNLEKVKEKYTDALKNSASEDEKAVAHRYLGSINHTLENYDEAEVHFKIAKDKFENSQNPNVNEYSRMLVTYADLQIDRANWRFAQDLANQCFDISSKTENFYTLAWAYRVLADTYFSMDDLPKAMDFIEKGIEFSKKIGSRNLLSRAYRRKAKYLIYLKRYAEAKESIRFSRALEKKQTDDNFDYNSLSKWENFINFKNGQDVNYKELHKQSELLKLKKHSKDETTNDYVLGYIYYSSDDEATKSKGTNILNRLHDHSMKIGNKQLQFAIETIKKFGTFIIISYLFFFMLSILKIIQ